MIIHYLQFHIVLTELKEEKSMGQSSKEASKGGLLEKAQIMPILDGGKQGDPINVMFNPAEYSLNKSNNFAEIAVPGLESPIIQFVRGQARSLSMSLFFDTYETGDDVRDHTDELTNLLAIDSDLHAPPLVLFSWGFLSFTGILESVNTRFTMFNQIGIPVRATCTVSFKEYKALDYQLSEKPRFSSDVTKVRTVIEGDTLWSIAAREYGRPENWRLIAEANLIDDPRVIEVGQKLIIPPRE